jgi:hypothetical protein
MGLQLGEGRAGAAYASQFENRTRCRISQAEYLTLWHINYAPTSPDSDATSQSSALEDILCF